MHVAIIGNVRTGFDKLFFDIKQMINMAGIVWHQLIQYRNYKFLIGIVLFSLNFNMKTWKKLKNTSGSTRANLMFRFIF